MCCDVTGGCAVGEILITLRETSSSAQPSRGQSWEAEPRVVAQYDLKKAKRQVGTNEYFTARRHRQRCGQKWEDAAEGKKNIHFFLHSPPLCFFFFFKASLSSIHLQRASADTLTKLTNSGGGRGSGASHAASDNERRTRGNAGWRNEILHKTSACIGLFARPGGPGTGDWNLLVSDSVLNIPRGPLHPGGCISLRSQSA